MEITFYIRNANREAYLTQEEMQVAVARLAQARHFGFITTEVFEINVYNQLIQDEWKTKEDKDFRQLLLGNKA